MTIEVPRATAVEKTVTFLKQLAPFAEAEKSTIVKALAIAHVAHGQVKRDSGELFVEHPIEAASTLVRLGVTDVDIICGALLHDVAEDTNYFYKGFEHIGYRKYVGMVREKLVAQGFSERTVKIVVALTKPAIIDEGKDGIVADGVDFFNKDQSYDKKHDLLEQAANDGFWEAILVKMAERLHNIRTFYPNQKKGKLSPWPKILETINLMKVFLKATKSERFSIQAACLASDLATAMVESMKLHPRPGGIFYSPSS
jgi:(p)ppGpp synthase/HD superfamily hydrolase